MSNERGSRRCRGDAGQVGGIEVLPFGFLVFVGGTLLFVNVWAVIDAKFAVTAAAREATRAFVEADSVADAVMSAELRGRETLVAFGRGGNRASIEEPHVHGTFGRCSRVTITVSYDVPALTIPFIGGFGSLAPIRARHTELVDPFRDGLAGRAAC